MSYIAVKQTESFRVVLLPLKSEADFSNSGVKKLNMTQSRREQCHKGKQNPFCCTNFALRDSKEKSHGCYEIIGHSSKREML